MFQQFWNKAHVYGLIQPRQRRCGSDLELDVKVHLLCSLLRQIDQRLVHVHSENAVPALRPQSRLSTCAATDIGYVEYTA